MNYFYVKYKQARPGVWRYSIEREDGTPLYAPIKTRLVADKRTAKLERDGWRWVGEKERGAK